MELTHDQKTLIKNGIRLCAIDLDRQRPGWAEAIKIDLITTIAYFSDPNCHGSGCVVFAGIESGMHLRVCEAAEAATKTFPEFAFIPCKEWDKFYVACWHEEILSRRAAKVTLPPKPPVLLKVVEQCLALAK